MVLVTASKVNRIAVSMGSGHWDTARRVVTGPANCSAPTARGSAISRQPTSTSRATASTSCCPSTTARAVRLARKRAPTGDSPVTCRAVIHESALHTRVGGPAVMRRQLLRLTEASRLPNVTAQVHPFEAGVYSAHTRSFVLFGGGAPELDTVYLEHPTNSPSLIQHVMYALREDPRCPTSPGRSRRTAPAVKASAWSRRQQRPAPTSTSARATNPTAGPRSRPTPSRTHP